MFVSSAIKILSFLSARMQ